MSLRIWNAENSHFRLGAYLWIRYHYTNPIYSFYRYDPLLRCLTGAYNYMLPMDPVSESGILDGSYHDDVRFMDLSTKPVNYKVRETGHYDSHHYGSFTDPLQTFWSVINGKLDLAPPAKIASQHLVRHRSFKGEGTAHIIDLADGVYEHESFEEIFGVSIPLKYYPSTRYRIATYPNGEVDYGYASGNADFLDLTTFFDYLQSKSSHSCVNIFDGGLFETTLTNFRFKCDKSISFSYDVSTHEESEGIIYDFSYHVYYRGGDFVTLMDAGEDPRVLGYGHTGATIGVSGFQSNIPTAFADFEYTDPDSQYCRVIGRPSLDADVDGVTEHSIRTKLFNLAQPFWLSVEENNFDLTALSRDTATTALTRLSNQAFSPTVGKISAINPLRSLGESLIAKTGDAALGDFFRMTWKKILGLGGGAGLVRYRTVFSDALQLINSLEVLDSLRKEPSRLYSASAEYSYPIELGGRSCTVRVRSKAYLELSPFGLLQILIGRQGIIIINDLLALYYTSIPFGEILLTVLQLRRIGDYISTRMFYDLPMFFVHSYLVESQLSQAELDNTGISSNSGRPVRLTYYIRDVSQYLPVLRFSNLASFYGTGDVGNVIWSLLQQLVGVLVQ